MKESCILWIFTALNWTPDLCGGLRPFYPGEASEQRLTISESGHIRFTEYYYSNDSSRNECAFPLGRKEHVTIPREAAKKILSLIWDLYESGQFCFATDIGLWHLTITDKQGNKYKMHGPACGLIIHNIKLSGCVAKCIPIKDFAVFGGIECE